MLWFGGFAREIDGVPFQTSPSLPSLRRSRNSDSRNGNPLNNGHGADSPSNRHRSALSIDEFGIFAAKQSKKGPKTKKSSKYQPPPPPKQPPPKLPKASYSKSKGKGGLKGGETVSSKAIPPKSKSGKGAVKISKRSAKSSKTSKSTKRPDHPTQAPSIFTTDPDDGNAVAQLTDFVVGYDISQDSLPTDFDVDEVVDVTRSYLDEYIRERMGDQASIDAVNVGLASHRLKLDAPYEIEYNASVVLADSKASSSTQETLEEVVSDAFTGDLKGSYIVMLQKLGGQNIFGA